MESDVNRRRFMGAAVASGVFAIVPRHVLGGSGYVAPSDKITLAHIGMGTQGFNELGEVLAEPQIQIVAVCDPNTDSNDYVEWSKDSVRDKIRTYLGNPSWRENQSGCPGGREIGREVVDTYYANQRKTAKFKACAAYADFRELLDKEKDLDAVKIMTPDHLHATISIAAMRKGKHVLMHKPLANRMGEARLVVETARKTKVATHLLAYGMAAANGRIAARIQEGAIGALREIHNWSNRPFWPQYTEIAADRPPVPKGFDWDLWLGPALFRPYHPHYTHAVFRGWYDFGGGSMADMGIYSLWPVLTALGLDSPLSAQAAATHTCSIVDQVSRTVKNDFSYPAACSIRFKFAARAGVPAVDLFWYDGGMKPRVPEQLETLDVEMPGEGILFVGEQGTIMAGFFGQNPRRFSKGKSEALEINETAPQGAKQGQGEFADRYAPWIQAVRGGEPSPGSFLNAGPISDCVNLGTVALRAGEKVLLDSQNMRITNVADANKYLRREYRKGWELETVTTKAILGLGPGVLKPKT
jgi:predicted dehydrogenase